VKIEAVIPYEVFVHIYHSSRHRFTDNWHLLALQRGVTSTARHSENVTCRGVTSTALHPALSHSFNYISTTKGENVIGLLCTCSRRIWLSYGVGDSSYKLLLHFFLSSRSLGLLFAVRNFTAGFMRLWNEEMKYEAIVIALVT
jgi:hypothetical protein